MKTFEEMARIDVTAKMEKKGKFTFLSWPFAVSEFRKNCPQGIWATVKHNGSPVLATEHGYFVEVEVTPDTGFPTIKFSQIHPILDSNNKPVAAPNAFQVNTSIQRCLVKAIAIATGIGLHIYAGEDLPEDAATPETPRAHIRADLSDDTANEKASALCAEIDGCTTHDTLLAWGKASKKQIEALPDTQKAKVYSYWKQIEAIITETKTTEVA